MSNQDARKTESLVHVTIATHIVLVASLLTTLVWLVPRFGAVLREIIGGHIPDPFIHAVEVAYFARNNIFLFLPALVILLWLDFILSRRLCSRVGGGAVIVWSVAVSAALAGFILWLFYAVSTFWPELFHHA